MNELKEYPTDDDYDARYWRAFLKSQKEHRADLERLAREAADSDDLEWLSNQMIVLGVKQHDMKGWLIRSVLKPCLQVDWGEKTPAWLRREIMAATNEIPRWQRWEALYIIDMYHDIMEEMSLILKARGR